MVFKLSNKKNKPKLKEYTIKNLFYGFFGQARYKQLNIKCKPVIPAFACKRPESET